MNLGFVAAGILGICYVEEVIDPKTAQMIGAVIGSFTGIAFRSTWSKQGAKK